MGILYKLKRSLAILPFILLFYAGALISMHIQITHNVYVYRKDDMADRSIALDEHGEAIAEKNTQLHRQAEANKMAEDLGINHITTGIKTASRNFNVTTSHADKHDVINTGTHTNMTQADDEASNSINDDKKYQRVVEARKLGKRLHPADLWDRITEQGVIKNLLSWEEYHHVVQLFCDPEGDLLNTRQSELGLCDCVPDHLRKST